MFLVAPEVRDIGGVASLLGLVDTGHHVCVVSVLRKHHLLDALPPSRRINSHVIGVLVKDVSDQCFGIDLIGIERSNLLGILNDIVTLMMVMMMTASEVSASINVSNKIPGLGFLFISILLVQESIEVDL